MTEKKQPLSDKLTIAPLRGDEIDELIALARDIWYRHYPSIITVEQIDYMLAQRYHPDVVREQLSSEQMWWDTLSSDGRMIAFAAYELSEAPREMKLDKLYVNYELRGRGLGSRLLQHVAEQARCRDCTTLVLQVNKNNHDAIETYRRNGFSVREAAKFDIGNGFFMDDYVMAKDLTGG